MSFKCFSFPFLIGAFNFYYTDHQLHHHCCHLCLSLGATYAIPAVAQYTVTRPGYTTYQEGPSIVRNGYVPTSVPVATITKHQAVAAIPAAPYAYAAAPFAAHAYAPYGAAW